MMNVSQRSQGFLPSGCFLIVFGAVCFILNLYSTSIPFYDEWDAEASWLYLLYEQGELGFSEVLSPHNGHRLPLTRLTALAFYIFNGGWDPQLQMIVSGIVHALICTVLLSILMTDSRRPVPRSQVIATLFLFVIPFSWLSVLVAFQTQFYFMMLFSILAIKQFLSERVWSGYGYGILAMLSMTPGMLVLPAFMLALLIDAIRNKSLSHQQLGHIMLCLALAAIFILTLPQVSVSSPYYAQHIRGFVVTAVAAVSWPFSLRDGVGAIIYIPFVLLLSRAVLRLEVPAVLLGLGLFISLQIIAIAYFRGEEGVPPPNRYWEILIVGIWLNGASLTFLLRAINLRLVKVFAGVWMIVVAFGMTMIAYEAFDQGLPDRYKESLVAQSLITDYLQSSDRTVFDGYSGFESSYPDASALMSLLDRPDIRNLLPTQLGGRNADNLQGLKTLLLSLHWLLIGIGIVLLTPHFIFGFKQAAKFKTGPA